jgi:hypothetical protein
VFGFAESQALAKESFAECFYLPSAALNKIALCRVSDIIHSAKHLALGKSLDSSSVRLAGKPRLWRGSAIRSHSRAAAALIPSPVRYAAAMLPLAEDGSPLSTVPMQAVMTGGTSNFWFGKSKR